MEEEATLQLEQQVTIVEDEPRDVPCTPVRLRASRRSSKRKRAIEDEGPAPDGAAEAVEIGKVLPIVPKSEGGPAPRKIVPGPEAAARNALRLLRRQLDSFTRDPQRINKMTLKQVQDELALMTANLMEMGEGHPGVNKLTTYLQLHQLYTDASKIGLAGFISSAGVQIAITMGLMGVVVDTVLDHAKVGLPELANASMDLTSESAYELMKTVMDVMIKLLKAWNSKKAS